MVRGETVIDVSGQLRDDSTVEVRLLVDVMNLGTKSDIVRMQGFQLASSLIVG